MKDIRDERSHIFEIQKRLYILRKSGIPIPLVIPDGIFGQSTREAVLAFSLAQGLGEKAFVDLAVWERLTECYRALSL